MGRHQVFDIGSLCGQALGLDIGSCSLPAFHRPALTCPLPLSASQTELAKACPGLISSRFIGNVFSDELGTPGTFYYVRWASNS